MLTPGRAAACFRLSAHARAPAERQVEEAIMAWTAPIIEEVTCGLEINLYFPAEEDGTLF